MVLKKMQRNTMKDYVEKYGKTETTEVTEDRQNGKQGRFAFLTFDGHDRVGKIVVQKYQIINAQSCEVEKALSKQELQFAAGSPRSHRGGSGNFMGYGGNSGSAGGTLAITEASVEGEAMVVEVAAAEEVMQEVMVATMVVVLVIAAEEAVVVVEQDTETKG